jgi:ribose transport system substrate-binding protein
MRRIGSWRRAAGLSAAAALAVAGLSTSTAATTASATTAASTRATALTGGRCGADVVYPASVNDPSGVLETLPAPARREYGAWPYPVGSTPWATFKGARKPWRIGLVMPAIASPWQADLLAEARREFAQARAAGLVTGSLVTSIQRDRVTQSGSRQIAAIARMVQQGVDGILVLPLGGSALGGEVTAAGRAGVPIVVLDDAIPSSAYAVNVWWQSSSAAAAVAGLVGKGNLLVVSGPAGDAAAQAFQRAAVADVAACPRLRIAGTIDGDWTDATAKSIVESFLAMHPGLPIDGVLQSGLVMAGVVDAYQTAGITPVPPISDGGCQGADLSWWLARRSTYRTVGACVNGFQAAHTELAILLRILAGRGLKVNDVAIGAPPVSNANLGAYATPNEPLDWTGEAKGALDAICSQTCLDAYFARPGTPGGF